MGPYSDSHRVVDIGASRVDISARDGDLSERSRAFRGGERVAPLAN